jgi:hypothetical protein
VAPSSGRCVSLTYLRKTLLLEILILGTLTLGVVDARFPFISSLLAQFAQFARILIPNAAVAGSILLAILLSSLILKSGRVPYKNKKKVVYNREKIAYRKIWLENRKIISRRSILKLFLTVLSFVVGIVLVWLAISYSQFIPWVEHLPMEQRAYLSALIPSALTIGLAFVAITGMQRVADNTRWSSFEPVVRQMNPAVDIPLTLFSLAVLALGWQAFPFFVRPFVIWAFAAAMIALGLAISNWYLTSILFTQQSYTIDHEHVTLVDNHRNRKIAWLLLNGFAILVVWVFWTVTVVVWRLISG